MMMEEVVDDDDRSLEKGDFYSTSSSVLIVFIA